MGKELTSYCADCNARCCRYFTVPLERPEDWDDFDAMHWYMLHEGVSIYVDDEGDWYVNIGSRCRALGAENLCRVYDHRPDICRDHTDEVCEKNETPYDFRAHFHTAEELMDYARRFMSRKEQVRIRRSEAARRAWRTRQGVGGDQVRVPGDAAAAENQGRSA